MKILKYLVIFVVTIEIILRLVGFGHPILYKKTIDNFYPKPNQETKRYKGSNIKINYIGMRTNFNWEDSEKKKKIVILGDSVTYGGSYIDNKDLFSEILCQEYIENSICGNLGVNGYLIDNIFLRLKDINEKYYDHIIILVSSKIRTGKTNIYEFPFYQEYNYFILRATFELLNHILFKYEIYNAYKKNRKINKIKEIEQTQNFINLINDISTKKKISFFVLPALEDLKSKNKNIRLLEETKFKNIDLINLYDEIVKENYEDLYFNDAHLNKKGHRYVAKIIYDKIK
tara:strand:+ start:1039 stop:1899 length:861 start_codon:yes stop_codon:yes gene_type:complete